MNPIDTSVFVSKFVEEARDRLKALGAALLRLEQTPGATDAIAEALREAHSIKGSALMLGFTDISQISHKLEELFVAAKTNAVAARRRRVRRHLHRRRSDEHARSSSSRAARWTAIEVGDICAQLAAVLRTRGLTPVRKSR